MKGSDVVGRPVIPHAGLELQFADSVLEIVEGCSADDVNLDRRGSQRTDCLQQYAEALAMQLVSDEEHHHGVGVDVQVCACAVTQRRPPRRIASSGIEAVRQHLDGVGLHAVNADKIVGDHTRNRENALRAVTSEVVPFESEKNFMAGEKVASGVWDSDAVDPNVPACGEPCAVHTVDVVHGTRGGFDAVRD